MTSFNSPSRPHLTNGIPCWLTDPFIALPDLCISPIEPDLWEVRLMLTQGFIGHWESVTVTLTDLIQLIKDWKDDPENTLAVWFNASPPISEPYQIKKLDDILDSVLKPKPISKIIFKHPFKKESA